MSGGAGIGMAGREWPALVVNVPHCSDEADASLHPEPPPDSVNAGEAQAVTLDIRCPVRPSTSAGLPGPAAPGTWRADM